MYKKIFFLLCFVCSVWFVPNNCWAQEKGWVEQDDYKYYYDENGSFYTGIHEIDGAKYYFNEKGQLQHLLQTFITKSRR